MSLTLADIAAQSGSVLQGDGARPVTGVASLDKAGPQDLTFFTNPKYAAQLATTRAAAVFMAPADAERPLPAGVARLINPQPYLAYARLVAERFDARPRQGAGLHPSAQVHPTASVDPSANVGALAVIDAGAQVGPGASIGALCYVGPGVSVGSQTRLYPAVTLLDGVKVGARCIIHSGTVVGSDGFGFAPDFPKGWVKVPQLGGVSIEDDVEVQGNVCIDRGALEDTVIRKGAKLDNLVHVAHNVEIGSHSMVTGQVGFAGSAKLGQWVSVGGQAGIGGHLTVHDGASVAAQAGVGKDIGPKETVAGTPAQPLMQARRQQAELGRVAELRQKVKELEARLAELEKRGKA